MHLKLKSIRTLSFQNIGDSELQKIVNGESSAVQAYEIALEKMDRLIERNRLKKILNEHKEALAYWRTKLEKKGKTAKAYQSIWEQVVNSLMRASSLLSKEKTLLLLKKGESFGLRKYKKLIEHSREIDDLKRERVEFFLKSQAGHIDCLNEVLRMQ